MPSCQLVVPLSFFVNFEQITHLVLEFTLLTLSRLIPAGNILIFAFVYIYFANIFTVTKTSSFYRDF